MVKQHTDSVFTTLLPIIMYYKLSTVQYLFLTWSISCRKLYSSSLGIFKIFSFEVELKNLTYCEVRNAKWVSSTIIAICVAG